MATYDKPTYDNIKQSVIFDMGTDKRLISIPNTSWIRWINEAQQDLTGRLQVRSTNILTLTTGQEDYRLTDVPINAELSTEIRRIYYIERFGKWASSSTDSRVYVYSQEYVIRLFQNNFNKGVYSGNLNPYAASLYRDGTSRFLKFFPAPDATTLLGTISSSGTAVVGVGTTFLTDFEVGDIIVSDGQQREIASITNDLNLVTTVAFSPVLSGETYEFGKRVRVYSVIRINARNHNGDVITDTIQLESDYEVAIRKHIKIKIYDGIIKDMNEWKKAKAEYEEEVRNLKLSLPSTQQLIMEYQ